MSPSSSSATTGAPTFAPASAFSPTILGAAWIPSVSESSSGNSGVAFGELIDCTGWADVAIALLPSSSPSSYETVALR